MDDGARRISDSEWAVIVRNAPIVSVDLVVRTPAGIVLGNRQNEPVKGEWFVPGGTVCKNERLEAAAHRVATEELGCEIAIVDRLGTFEQFYGTADVQSETGKHYVATAFLVEPEGEPVATDAQHAELRAFHAPFPEFHPYVERYLDAIGVLERDARVEDREAIEGGRENRG